MTRPVDSSWQLSRSCSGRLEASLVQLDTANVPLTAAALQRVRFDENGEPILATIEPPVRALAAGVIGALLDADRAIRRDTSPVISQLGQPVTVDDEVLRQQAVRDECRTAPALRCGRRARPLKR